MSGNNDDLIILIDENGNEVEAEYIDTIEYRGNAYVVLLPKEEHVHAESEDCDCDEEVVILKIDKDADGDEETLIAIDDDDEQEAVFQIFTQRIEEAEYDEDDFEEDDDADPGSTDADDS